MNQKTRIQKMTQIYYTEKTNIETLKKLLSQLQHSQQDITELESYYSSPLFLQDYDAQHNGQLDGTIDTTIFGEDTIYDFLEERDEVLQELYEYLETIQNNKS